MGQLLDLVRSLKLDAPETWLPPEFVGPLESQAQPPTFRTSNQVDAQGNPVVADESLPGWRGAADTALNALVGTVKGVTGLGDQGPAGPSWQNFGALAAAVPIGMPETFLGALANKMPRFAKALQAYHAPTTAGKLAAPFYSRLEDTVAALPKSFGAGALAKGGASAEELAMRGVPEFLGQQGTRPIAKGAMEGHLAAHPVPELQVKTLGGPPPSMLSVQRGPSETGREGYRIVNEQTGALVGFADTYSEARDIQDRVGTSLQQGAPKFSQYQLPGGTNYRETLITLPEPAAHAGTIREAEANLATAEATLRDYRTAHPEAEILGLGDPGYRTHVLARNEAGSALSRARAPMIEQRFRSAHFDEPNILVHTRSNERELPGLGKGTFLEEVQSDWHQKGKESGYQRNLPKLTAQDVEVKHITNERIPSDAYWETYDRRTGDLVSRHPGAHTEDRVLRDALELGPRSEPGVPDAPFKDTWPDLALKHHLAEAAQNPETQWIGFTSGQTQAARYDLSKQISKVEFDAGDRQLRAFDHHGKQVIQQTTDADRLSDYIGKEAAKKLLETKPSLHPEDQTPIYTLAGVDLKVGGEGMKHFYDNLLPKRLEKIVKPYGGTVERMPILGPEFPEPITVGDRAAAAARRRNQVDDGSHDAWVLRLTPELKQRILRYGLPLLTGVAAVDLAEVGR